MAEVKQSNKGFMGSIIIGFTGYKVTKRGNIISIAKGRMLKKRLGNHGYYAIFMNNDQGKKVHKQISRLVALAFVKNPKPGIYNIVMHKDNDRTNDHYKNLKWGTQAQNVKQCVNEGRIAKGNRLPQTKATVKICKKIILSSDTHKGTAKRFNVSRRLVRFIKAGKTSNAQKALRIINHKKQKL